MGGGLLFSGRGSGRRGDVGAGQRATGSGAAKGTAGLRAVGGEERVPLEVCGYGELDGAFGER